jgi:hypothetical protein
MRFREPKKRLSTKELVKSYFRYQHFNTNPCLESHSKFMTCLGFLEGKTDTTLAESGSLEESWKEILSAINSLSEEDIDHLHDLTRRKYK